MSLDDYNYARDPRTQGPAKKPVLSFFGCGSCGKPVTYQQTPKWTAVASCDCKDFEVVDIEEELPTKWMVCPVCDGEGKHVNPSIDCNGISREQFEDDPDFAEQYWNGTYDQTCTRCKGRTTIQIADLDAMTSEQRALYTQQLIDEARDHQECLSEIRMGC